MIDTIETAAAVLSRFFKMSQEDYFHPERLDSEFAIASRDGSLMSVVKIHGSLELSGQAEYEYTTGKVIQALKGYISGGGHAIQVLYDSDPDTVSDHIKNMVAPSVNTAKTLNIKADDLFDDDINALTPFVSNENVYLVLHTKPSLLTKDDIKADRKAKMEVLKDNPLPNMGDSPSLFNVVQNLRNKHSSFVDSFIDDLTDIKLLVDLLPVSEAVYRMRLTVDKDNTDVKWRPTLIGDAIPVRDTRRNKNDHSGWIWPSIGEQLAFRDTEEMSRDVIRSGNTLYFPLFIHVHQADILPFHQLLRRVDRHIPWRISFFIEPQGLSTLAAKNFLHLIFSFTSPGHNKRYKMSRDAITDLVENHNDLDVRYRIDFATWAPAHDPALLDQRTSMLVKAVQGWGVTEVKSYSGDLYESFISSGLGLTVKPTATAAVASLEDVCHQLPLHRPASPWKDSGSVLYRTEEGSKVWPIKPMSTEFSSAITFMIAEPRYGKSLLANIINYALCLNPGNKRLPLLSIIDVGTASSGLISLLKYSMPEDKRHQVQMMKMRMEKKYGVNFFDTQLGCRNPINSELQIIKNFLLLLLTPDGHTEAAEGMEGVVDLAVTTVYKMRSDEGNPTIYTPNRSIEIDDKLVDINFNPNFNDETDELGKFTPKTTWWNVVDALFDAGYPHEAMLAQRYAVPQIKDVISCASQPQFTDLYEEKTVYGTESILKAFTRMLSECVGKYPIISSETSWDIGDARVLSIDIEDVIDKQKNGCQQNALVYSIATFVSTRNFMLTEDLIPLYPMKYREYHRAKIMAIREDIKHIQFDEWHRTAGVDAVEKLVDVFLREGGKRGVGTTLISQRVSDFPDRFLEWGTSVYVLSPQSHDNATKIQELYNLPESTVYVMKERIKPPNKEGSTFLGYFRTVKGSAVHLLKNTIGSRKLWAFSTSSQDTFVRDRMYEVVGPTIARQVLAAMYPGGSLKSEYEERKQRLIDSGVIDAGQDDEGVLPAMLEEALMFYKEMRINGKI